MGLTRLFVLSVLWILIVVSTTIRPTVAIYTSTTTTPTTTPIPTPTTTHTTTHTTTTSRTTDDSPTPYPFSGTIWALLVAGSNGFYNYRHQADICHAYQILIRNGIPRKNIIVMMYDDIADNLDNPRKGTIINRPGGSDVYSGIIKDYVGEEVNATNFLNVLKGNRRAMNGIGSGRVVESGPNDHVFVNFVDHGGPGALMFPNDELMADHLISTLKDMANDNKFKKLILYIEACYAGSMFDSLLPDNLNIFVTTAADPLESSYACYYDETIGTYLGDVFSVNWMEDTEKESLTKESLNHQFEIVRSKTNTSHVEEYGDLDIGSTKLVNVLGKDVSTLKMKNLSEKWRQPNSYNDVVVSHNVSVATLQKQLQHSKGTFKRKNIKLKLHQIYKKRKLLDELFDRLISEVAAGSQARAQELYNLRGSLNSDNFNCYKTIFQYFSQQCFKISKNPYVAQHLQKFVNFCSLSWTRVNTMIDAIGSECDGWQNQFVGIHSII